MINHDDLKATRPSDRLGLLVKARDRTERELSYPPSASTSHYAAAALGQSPYVAMSNGAIVVQRRCSHWNC